MTSSEMWMNGENAPLGSVLRSLLEKETGPIIIVSPFITMSAFQKLNEVIRPDDPISVFTRWTPSEIAMGVSDPTIYPLIANGNTNRAVFILRSLHAKLYRRGRRALLGSANLTVPGLGWASQSNEELLVEVSSDTGMILTFLEHLRRVATPVDREIFERVIAQSKEMEPSPPTIYDTQAIHLGFTAAESAISEASEPSIWIPRTSQPNTLYKYYRGDTAALSRPAIVAAPSDIAYLRIPLGLPKPGFETYVAEVLTKEPIITLFDHAIRQQDPIAAFSQRLKIEHEEAEAKFEIVQNWVFKFFKGQYSYRPLPNGIMRAVKNNKLSY